MSGVGRRRHLSNRVLRSLGWDKEGYFRDKMLGQSDRGSGLRGFTSFTEFSSDLYLGDDNPKSKDSVNITVSFMEKTHPNGTTRWV